MKGTHKSYYYGFRKVETCLSREACAASVETVVLWTDVHYFCDFQNTNFKTDKTENTSHPYIVYIRFVVMVTTEHAKVTISLSS
jgi:hypothetical protein